MKTGNVVLSALVTIFGVAMVLSAIAHAGDGTTGSGAYHAGRMFGVVLAVVMIVAGIRGLRIEMRRRDSA